MRIFYMNQGGGGNWGAINYAAYDLLLCAEGGVIKKGFEEAYNSETDPAMQIQVKEDSGRMISTPRDLDTTLATVRPIILFQLRSANVYVVFLHLKSGNEAWATRALETAIKSLKAIMGSRDNVPILWIGDFNRADLGVLQSSFSGYAEVARGGGQARWNLDGAVVTGLWTREVSAKIVSKSGDHGHIAIDITIDE